MSNIKIILSPNQADALMTILSGMEKGSVLEGLYRALGDQFSRAFNYKLVDSGSKHDVYNTPLVQLVARRDA